MNEDRVDHAYLHAVFLSLDVMSLLHYVALSRRRLHPLLSLYIVATGRNIVRPVAGSVLEL